MPSTAMMLLAAVLVVGTLAANIQTEDGTLTLVVDQGSKVGYKIGRQPSVYFDAFPDTIKSEAEGSAAFLRAGLDMGAKLGEAEATQALKNMQTEILKEVDAKVALVNKEVQIVKSAGTAFNQQIVAVGGACMATASCQGEDVAVGIAGTHPPFTFEGAYTCKFERASDKYAVSTASKASLGGLGGNTILCPSPTYPRKMTYKEKTWEASLTVAISGKVLGTFNNLKPTVPFSTSAPVVAFPQEKYSYTDSALVNKANKMTIDLDFEDVDTFAEDVKFKLESSKQAVVKDSNMAVKITGGGKAVLSFTTEKLGGMGITTVFTVQATDNHDRTTKTSATLVFDLAFVFKTGKSVPTSGLKNFWDKNGLFYWLGTKGGTTQAWANPWRLGSVALSRTPYYSSQKENGIMITRPETSLGRSTYTAWTRDHPDGAWYFALKGGRKLSMTHYTIRHGNHVNYRPVNWQIQCKNPANGQWFNLDNRINSRVINSRHESVTYAVNLFTTRAAPYCSQFRLRQGRSSSGNYWMTISGFEIYGTYLADASDGY